MSKSGPTIGASMTRRAKKNNKKPPIGSTRWMSVFRPAVICWLSLPVTAWLFARVNGIWTISSSIRSAREKISTRTKSWRLYKSSNLFKFSINIFKRVHYVSDLCPSSVPENVIFSFYLGLNISSVASLIVVRAKDF